MTKEQKEKALAFLKDMQECTYDGVEEIRTAIECLEQPTSDDCVSRKAVDHLCFEYLKPNTDDNIAFYEHFCDLPPVTPTQCIAAVRFSKEDLREICNERIEIECTHGTCKDCTNYVAGVLDEEICIRGHELIHKDFYCADFEKRGGENE